MECTERVREAGEDVVCTFEDRVNFKGLRIRRSKVTGGYKRVCVGSIDHEKISGDYILQGFYC